MHCYMPIWHAHTFSEAECKHGDFVPQLGVFFSQCLHDGILVVGWFAVSQEQNQLFYKVMYLTSNVV